MGKHFIVSSDFLFLTGHNLKKMSHLEWTQKLFYALGLLELVRTWRKWITQIE